MTNPSRPWIGAALAGAIVALSATAIAQTTAPSTAPVPAASHAQRHAERMERLTTHRAEHQARLKQSLQLTPAQEPAWNALVAQMQPPARPQGLRQGWNDLTTPQRLDRMEALKAERDQAMRQRHDAIRAFYAQLTPAQQKTFDAEGMGIGRHAGMKRGGHGHHHGMGDMPRL